MIKEARPPQDKTPCRTPGDLQWSLGGIHSLPFLGMASDFQQGPRVILG